VDRINEVDKWLCSKKIKLLPSNDGLKRKRIVRHAVTTLTPLQEYKEITSKEVMDPEIKKLLFGGDLGEIQKLEARSAEETNYDDESKSNTESVMDVNYFVDRDPYVVSLELFSIHMI
jgi:hypothetical protein